MKLLQHVTIFTSLCCLLCLGACTSELDAIQEEKNGQSSSEGISATIHLPGGATSKTIDITPDAISDVALYAVTLGDETKDVAYGAGSVTFGNLHVGEYTLVVVAYADEEKQKPVEYKSESVSILAGSTNEITATLDFIYQDTCEEYASLVGTITLPIDWSATKNAGVTTIQLIASGQEEGENVLASQSVQEGEMKCTFTQEIPITPRKGSYVHFRFLNAQEVELGSSQMEVMRIAANQSSHLVDPLNNGEVSSIVLNANALNAGKGVGSAKFVYTKTPGELQLVWTMPSSYCGMQITFYEEGKADEATITNLTRADLVAMGGAGEKTYENLTQGTTYFAELVVFHNDDGAEYPSAATTVSKIAPIPLTGLAINELSEETALEKGRSVTFTLSTNPENASDLGYTWSSQDESILAVEDEEKGTFRVKGYGRTTVQVASDVYDVTAVKEVTVPLGEVYNILASASTSQMLVSWTEVEEADSYTLTKYADGSLVKTVDGITGTSWNDDDLTTGVAYQYTLQANKSVDGVDVSGPVSAKTEEVTPASPTILIEGASAQSVQISASSLSGTELVKGDQITVSLSEEVEGITSYTWLLNGTSVDDKVHTTGRDIITIDSNTPGILSSKAGQIQYLTLIMSDGEKEYSASYQFTYVSVPVASIVIDTSLSSLTRGVNNQLVAHVEPLDADVQTFTWTSSNEELATIDSDGNITISDDMSSYTDAERVVTFTATSTSNESISATTSQITLIAPVESISITNAQKDLFVNGQNGYGSEQLSVTYYPSDASASEKTIVSSYSSNNGVATVSGLTVTPRGSGNATITVEGKNGIKAIWNASVYAGAIYYEGSNVTNQTANDKTKLVGWADYSYTMQMSPSLPSGYTYNWEYKNINLPGSARLNNANSATCTFGRYDRNLGTYEFTCTIKTGNTAVYSLSFRTKGVR